MGIDFAGAEAKIGTLIGTDVVASGYEEVLSLMPGAAHKTGKPHWI
jgi:hypothetical protein